MKRKILAALAFGMLLSNLAVFTYAEKKQGPELVSLLPASDAVITMDVQRFFNTALPTVLSGNQPKLAEIIGFADEMQAKTGIDLRQFQQLAIGVKFIRTGPKKFDFDAAVFARGQISSAGLLGASKLAADGKYREETIGGKTVYIFSGKEIAADKAPDDVKGETLSKAIAKVPSEIAVAAHDANTLVFGTVTQVRLALEGKTRVGSDLTTLLGKGSASVMSFAAKTPDGMAGFLSLDNDELGRNIDSIRYLYGSMDAAGDSASVFMTARTKQNAQAQSLYETLEGLQLVGKALLGGRGGANNQVYARMIDNAKFSSRGNEVMFELTIPKADLDVLASSIK